VAHANSPDIIWLPQRRSSVTRESQRRVARRSRTLSGDWLDHRRKQRPLHRNARRRDASLRSAPRQGPRYSTDRGSSKDAQDSRLLAREHSRVSATRRTRRVSRFDSSHSRAIASRTASRIATRSLNSLPADITGSRCRSELHRGEVESFRGVTPLAIREYLSDDGQFDDAAVSNAPRRKTRSPGRALIEPSGKMRTWCPL